MSILCNVEDLDDFEKNDCYYPKGGIGAIGVLKTGHGITNFSNTTQMQAAVTAGKLVIIKGIKAELPPPSEVEGENPLACGSETIVDGYNYELTWTDFNVNAINDESYRKLNISQFPGLILWMCQEDQIRVVEQTVSFGGGINIPKSNKEKQNYPYKAKWSQSVQDSFPVLHEAPVGIFS